MSANAKISGSWKDVSDIQCKVSSTWIPIDSGYAKVSGTWQQFYSAVVPSASDYDLLETTVLTADTASVSFTSLNSTYGSTYKHLQIRITARTDESDTAGFLLLRINNDSGSSYARHVLYGTGSSVLAFGRANETFIGLNRTAASNSVTNAFGGIVADILDPFSTSKNTTVRALGGYDEGFVALNSGAFFNTSAVNEINILPGDASNIVTGSRFSLYGIKDS